MARVCSSTTRVGIKARDVGTALLLSSSGCGYSLPDSESVASTSTAAEIPDPSVDHLPSPEAKALHHHYTTDLGILDGPSVKWFCNFVSEMQLYPRCIDHLMAPTSRINTTRKDPNNPRVIVDGREIHVETGHGQILVDLDTEAAEFVMRCMKQVESGVRSAMRSEAPTVIELTIARMRVQAELVIAQERLPGKAVIKEKLRALCCVLERVLKQEYAETASNDPNFFAIEDLPTWKAAISHPLLSSSANHKVVSDSVISSLMYELKRSKEEFPVLKAWEVLSESIENWRCRSQEASTVNEVKKKKGGD